MNIANSKAQMRKGILEYCILLTLRDHAAYTTEIIGRLKEAQIIVVEGTLYPILTRLKNQELLGYRWEESLQGPPRKYYFLTDFGRSFLDQLNTAWDELVNQIQNLKQI